MLYFSQDGNKNSENKYAEISKNNIIGDFNKNIILVDIAIIQQNFPSGGTLLPIFKDVLNEPINNERRQIVNQILNDSTTGEIYATNFIMYILVNPVGGKNHVVAPYLYDEIFEFKNVKYMQKYIDRVTSNSGWEVMIDSLDNFKVRFSETSSTWWNMPTPSQYRSGIYYSPEGILDLIQLRNSLLTERLKYEDQSILNNEKIY